MAASSNVGSIYIDIELETAQLINGVGQANKALGSLGSSTGSASRGVDSVGKSASQSGKSLDSMGNSAQSVGVSVATLSSQLSTLSRTIGVALSVEQIVAWGNAWVDLNNKLVNSAKASETLAQVNQRVFDIAQETRSSLGATATLYGRLERATRSAGTSTQDLIKLVETVNKGLTVSGATTEEASSTMTQLSQALASGVLRGEEFNSLTENGSRLAQALSDSLGVTIGQLRNMAAQGKLTTDVVVKGLLSQSNAIGKEFANTATTMSQAMTVATNNVTKFVGESSSISSGIRIFNTGIVSLSSNLDTLSSAFAGLVGIMGSRYLATLALSRAAQIKNAAAAAKETLATKAQAQAAIEAAAAEVRRAEAAQTASNKLRNKTSQELATAKATLAAADSEVQLAAREEESARVALEVAQAEKVLEEQRLKAQISQQGMIATSTRMAEARKGEVAAEQRLAAATAASEAAQTKAIEGKAAADKAAAAIQIADAEAVIAARQAQVVAEEEAVATGGLLSAGFGLIGGAAGALTIGLTALGGAMFYLWQKEQEADQKTKEFTDSLDHLNKAAKSMNNTDLRASIADANQAIDNQTQKSSELEAEIDKLTKARNKNVADGKVYGTTIEEHNGLLILAAKQTDELAQKQREYNKLQDSIKKSTDYRNDAQDQLNNNMLTAMGRTDEVVQKDSTLVGIQNQVAEAFGLTADQIKRVNSESEKYDPKSMQVSPATKKGDDYNANLEEQIKLLNIKDERVRAITKAEDAERKLTSNPNQIAKAGSDAGALYDAQKREEARKKAQQESESQDKKSARASEKVANKLLQMRNAADAAEASTGHMTLAQAQLTAVQSLGTKATAADIAEAKEQTKRKWEAAEATKGLADAEKLVPQLGVTQVFNEQTAQLQEAAQKGLITQQQFQAASEQLRQQYIVQMDQLQANQAVSPLQQAAGQVDPVQQLANQYAQQSKLRQEYEQQGVLDHNTALALQNAADTQYEKARVDAQWELWSNQDQAHQLTAHAIDALGQQASNIMSGLIDGSMSLKEAFASVGSTILNSVIQSFVEMGLQWVKSLIVGQIGMNSVTTASVVQAGTIATAWAPAAAAVSLASFGANAVPAEAGIAATNLVAAAFATPRKNGGPVSSGGMYRVGEGGEPEIYQANNGNQYMIPGDNGSVLSNNQLNRSGGSGGGSLAQTNNITINTTNGINQNDIASLLEQTRNQTMQLMRDQSSRSGGILEPRRQR